MKNVDTYYIRHTAELDIDDPTRQRLWDERRIAIHYPQYKSGQDVRGDIPKGKADNASLELDDYPGRARRVMRALIELAANGGYVCAEFYKQSQCLLGYVPPGSKIELLRGKWGSRNQCDGRQAILKSLKLAKVKPINPSESAVIFVARPRQGTMMRWPRAGKAIENIVEGKRAIPSLGDLSPDQQEIMCSEFLRTDTEFGLPKLAHLVLPVGRTMRGIDICGISSSGSVVFAQVTYLGFDHCGTKLDTLRCYRDGQGNALVLFCDCEEPEYKDGIHIIPLRKVYDAFVATTTGKLWLERATNI